MPPVINITTLDETANRYDPELKKLPFLTLMPVLAFHGINLITGIQNKDTITNFFRAGGIAKPYTPGTVEDSDIGKTQQRVLQTEKSYANVIDEPSQYKKTIIGPDTLQGKNKSKEYPWQLTMLQSIVRTFGEDVCDALFPAKYDVTDRSPNGLFNGFDTLIDADIANGNISAANGNLVNTGTIDKTTNAVSQLLGFWRAANKFLRNTNSLLWIPYDMGDAYDDDYFEKYKTKPTMDNYGHTVLDGTGGKCHLVRSMQMGSGQRIVLTVPGNQDFGVDDTSDDQFVQVRQYQKDPNFVQFWIQADYGCRIRNVHSKVFQVNEGVSVPNPYSGDYRS